MSLKTAKPFQRRIRKNILRLVGEKNITLERLAVEADLTSSFVSQVLAGRSSISLAALERLADVLGVDITELLRS
jgi:transcriptional regulator with XRE-family HTH domain